MFSNYACWFVPMRLPQTVGGEKAAATATTAAAATAAAAANDIVEREKTEPSEICDEEFGGEDRRSGRGDCEESLDDSD